jgi:hypothetical protein
MQTNAGGTAAEFASNIDVPGTLDVTGVGTFDANLRFNSGYGSAAVAYGCRAWVNFDGVPASPTIRAGGNVSSVTKVSTGYYIVSYGTAMPDTNYTVTCESAPDNAFTANGAWIVGVLCSSSSGPVLKSTTQVEIRTSDLTTGNPFDIYNGGVAIFR